MKEDCHPREIENSEAAKIIVAVTDNQEVIGTFDGGMTWHKLVTESSIAVPSRLNWRKAFGIRALLHRIVRYF